MYVVFLLIIHVTFLLGMSRLFIMLSVGPMTRLFCELAIIVILKRNQVFIKSGVNFVLV